MRWKKAIELVFHTTSRALWSGPSSTYLNVVTAVFIRPRWAKTLRRISTHNKGMAHVIDHHFHRMLSCSKRPGVRFHGMMNCHRSMLPVVYRVTFLVESVNLRLVPGEIICWWILNTASPASAAACATGATGLGNWKSQWSTWSHWSQVRQANNIHHIPSKVVKTMINHPFGNCLDLEDGPLLS